MGTTQQGSSLSAAAIETHCLASDAPTQMLMTRSVALACPRARVCAVETSRCQRIVTSLRNEKGLLPQVADTMNLCVLNKAVRLQPEQKLNCAPSLQLNDDILHVIPCRHSA